MILINRIMALTINGYDWDLEPDTTPKLFSFPLKHGCFWSVYGSYE